MLEIRASRQQKFLTLLAAALATAAAAGTLTHAGFLDGVKKGVKKAAEDLGKTRGQSRKVSTPHDTAAVRGIDEEEGGDPETAAERGGGGLEWLESLPIGDEDVDRFVREGKLRP